MSFGPNTKVTLTLTAVIALVAVGWRAGSEAAAIRTEIAELRRDIRTITASGWTQVDMERWSYQLDLRNRDLGLVVPNPREVRTPAQ
jgi:hypothetical protein